MTTEAAPAPLTIERKSAEEVVREIVEEGDADPRLVLLLERFEAKRRMRDARKATPAE